MKTAIKTNRTVAMAGAAAALAVAALGFAGAAQARDDVYWSVGVGSPGVSVNVGNAYPVYTQPAPVYVQPAPVYVRPAPVFVQPRPYYYGPPQVVYVQPGNRHGWHKRHDRDGDGYRDGYGYGYQQRGYAPVYYQR